MTQRGSAAAASFAWLQTTQADDRIHAADCVVQLPFRSASWMTVWLVWSN